MAIESSFTTVQELQGKLQLCDIVEFNRTKYSHFALYIGGGICVHVLGPNDGGISSFLGSKSGTKVAQKLSLIADKNRVRINNSETIAKKLGVKERRTEDSIALALQGLPQGEDGSVLLGHSIPVSYLVMSPFNCEGWATHWKYQHEIGWSNQAGNGLIHSTIGTIERVSEGVLCLAEETLQDESASLGWKAMAASVMVPYGAAKSVARGVRTATDVGLATLKKILH